MADQLMESTAASGEEVAFPLVLGLDTFGDRSAASRDVVTLISNNGHRFSGIRQYENLKQFWGGPRGVIPGLIGRTP
jgi:hypothetical protein